MRRRHPHPPAPPRAAFTQIELLVVIAVLSLLVSLSLPAMNSVRGRARRLECVNRQRQVGLAIASAADRLGRYPASGNFAATGSTQFHSWVVSILPELDQTVLFDRYDLDKGYRAAGNREVGATHVPLLVCPSDISVLPHRGNLTYVVNGGLAWTIPIDCPSALHRVNNRLTITPFDFNGNGIVCPFDEAADGADPDAGYLKRLSLFFIENWPNGTGTVRHHRPGDIADGQSQTLLLSENVRAGFDPRVNNSWAGPDPLRNMFFASSRVCPNLNCRAEGVRLAAANDHSTPEGRRESINGSLTQAEGTAPWPSSFHGGMVNATFCDGHVKALAENIDGEVYFALITPRGYRMDHPLTEPANPFVE